MTFTLRDVVHATSGRLLSGQASDGFDHVSIDTRTLRLGSAFFALRGPRYDGHDFLQMAADRGASVLIIDRLERYPDIPAGRSPSVILVADVLIALQSLGAFQRARSNARVVGITGSNGKTTTKEMLAAILRLSGPTLSTRGNLNNHIGLPLMLCDLRPEHRFAVIEMGTSKKGDMDLLARLTKADVGLITNVGKDHLEFLETPDGVLKENRVLFDDLPKEGIAVINLDDPLLAPLDGHLACRTLSYGARAKGTVCAGDVQAEGSQVVFSLMIRGQAFPTRLQTTGPLQALNAAAAAAVAVALDVAPETIVKGLEAFRPVVMRMQTTTLANGALLINDAYNANPSSVQASIDSFCVSYARRPRWLVLGDMRELGSIARDEHRELGRWLSTQPVERIFLYGRDTRFVLEGLGDPPSSMVVERFRKKRYLIEALKTTMNTASSPAILFKASRSLRLEQVITPLLDSASSSRSALPH